MQNIIIQIFTEIECRKQSENKALTTPLLMEIHTEIKKRFLHELAEMERAGIIRIGDTINDKYIKINV